MGRLQKLTQNLVVVLTSAYKRFLMNNKIELKLWLYSKQWLERHERTASTKSYRF